MSSVESKRPRTARFWTAALAILLTLAAWHPAQADLKKVRVAYGQPAITPSASPWLSAANTGGFWRDEGLDVEVRGINGLGAVLALLANGQLDAIFVGSSDTLRAIESGAPVKIVANAYDMNINYPVVLEGSPIHSITG